VHSVGSLRLVSPPRPQMLARLCFDTDLESQALRQLAGLDVDACHASFGRLVDQLDLKAPGVTAREVVALMLDVLLRVNRRLHRPPDGDAAAQENRAALIARFSVMDDAESARREFLPTLARLLSVLQATRSVHPVVEKAQNFIAENYQRRLALSGIARALNVSPNYLSRIFRKETGSTVTARIHEVRLEHARLLLAAGGSSISEIAYTVGYQNYRDFYRNFVKYERASPRQARRSMNRPRDAAPGRPGE
jgi:AraC-like DNA-binding protein